MGKLTFSMGGIHPHDSKFARERAIEQLPLPPTVYVSMAQHLGAPAKPVVAVGDRVKVGQVIAERKKKTAEAKAAEAALIAEAAKEAAHE